ncbi:MAG TPA: PqqD family protein [Gemmatimonadaceae bacterium]|nr:PqqD family protein [Gemmatimonadaceae bacterium]
MTSTFHDAPIFCRSSKVDETRVGDRVVLYHRDTGSGVVLNPTGSMIWDALATPRSAADLADDLAARYPGVVPEKISADVKTYVESLLENDLIASASQ